MRVTGADSMNVTLNFTGADADGPLTEADLRAPADTEQITAADGSAS